MHRRIHAPRDALQFPGFELVHHSPSGFELVHHSGIRIRYRWHFQADFGPNQAIRTRRKPMYAYSQRPRAVMRSLVLLMFALFRPGHGQAVHCTVPKTLLNCSSTSEINTACLATLDQLRPTQASLGHMLMQCKRTGFEGKTVDKMQKYIADHVVALFHTSM